MDPGKIDREFFETYIDGRLGADRDDVTLGPTHGADFGALTVGDRVVALATDPLFVLRDLGLERAAWFAFHIVLSDVALSGLGPTHLSVDFNLPPGTDPDTFGTIWEVFDREARALGVNIVTGHTGVYAGSDFPTVGGATALAVGDPDSLVLPTGASPGDTVVVTKGPAVETTGILAVVFGDQLDIDGAALEEAKDRFWDTSPVADALAAVDAGPVTAMHDATEGGIENGLHEVAAASGVKLVVERERIPVAAGVEAVCDAFDIDPWRASSSGSVIATVAAGGESAVVERLRSEGIPAAVVGTVEEGSGVSIDGEDIPVPETDPFWPAYERGLAASSN